MTYTHLFDLFIPLAHTSRALRISLCSMVVVLSACSYSDLRAPQAYSTNIIPTDSKFQGCAEGCLNDYANCTSDAGIDFAKDLQVRPISRCRTEYKTCILTCRKTYNEIFN